MKNIITITWFVLLMSGCQKNESNSVQKDNSSRHQLIKELAAGKDRFNYNNVEQGHYEDVFYFNDEVNLVVLDFEILKVYDEGKWLPLNSIKLVDQTGKKTLYVKYLATVEQKYFNIHIMIDGESYFDEDGNFNPPENESEPLGEGTDKF